METLYGLYRMTEPYQTLYLWLLGSLVTLFVIFLETHENKPNAFWRLFHIFVALGWPVTVPLFLVVMFITAPFR